MAEPNALGLRVKKRIKELNMTMIEVERTGGWTVGYITDLVNGRKKSVDYENLVKLARILKTTDTWLLRGDAVDQRPMTRAGERPVSVSDRFEAIAQIKRIDLDSGECGLVIDGSDVIAATIVDPVFQLPGNAYARSMFEMSPIRVLAKRATLANGTEMLIVIDAEKIDAAVD